MRNIEDFRSGVMERYRAEKQKREYRRKFAGAVSSFLMSFSVFVVGAVIFSSTFAAPFINVISNGNNKLSAGFPNLPGIHDDRFIGNNEAPKENNKVPEEPVGSDFQITTNVGENSPSSPIDSNFGTPSGSIPESESEFLAPTVSAVPETSGGEAVYDATHNAEITLPEKNDPIVDSTENEVSNPNYETDADKIPIASESPTLSLGVSENDSPNGPHVIKPTASNNKGYSNPFIGFNVVSEVEKDNLGKAVLMRFTVLAISSVFLVFGIYKMLKLLKMKKK